jgi:hypothetical protein
LLGKIVRNRSPNASRLKPTGGEISAAAVSRQNGGTFSCSSVRFDRRNRISPRKLPPMPVLIWSLRDGRLRSPAISHSALPANV